MNIRAAYLEPFLNNQAHHLYQRRIRIILHLHTRTICRRAALGLHLVEIHLCLGKFLNNSLHSFIGRAIETINRRTDLRLAGYLEYNV